MIFKHLGSDGIKTENNFGQRKCQTPFSSAFWFLDQNIISKISNLLPKNRGLTNHQSKTILGPKTFWVQKDFVFKQIFQILATKSISIIHFDLPQKNNF